MVDRIDVEYDDLGIVYFIRYKDGTSNKVRCLPDLLEYLEQNEKEVGL